jgi:aerobic carbon-monoxide dehydrogenase medium subunit
LLADASDMLGEELEPDEDQQASAATRRHLAKVLLTRGVATLLRRPELNASGGIA